MRKDLQHIQETLDRSARKVAEHQFSPKQKDRFGISHMGNEHISLPIFLQIDPVLEPVDKTVYSVIRILSPKSMSNEGAFPTYDDICKFANIGSHATISRALYILRITRWIVSREVRTFGGTAGNIYMTVDQPMDVQDHIEVDHGYLDHVAECTQHHHNRVTQVANAYLTQIENDILAGKTESSHPVSRAIESTEYLKGEDAPYFGINPTILEALKDSRYTKHEEKGSLNIEEYKDETKNSSLKFKELKNRASKPSLNFEENKKDTKTGSLNIKEGILPGSLKFKEPSSSCSSSYYKTTTTTTTKDSTKSKTSNSHVVYQDIGRDDELKKLIAKQFSMLNSSQQLQIQRFCLRIKQEDRRPIIFEVSNRILYGNVTIRNPVAYFGKMCGDLNRGEIYFSEFSDENYNPNAQNDQQKPKDPKADIKKELHDIKLELSVTWGELKNYEASQERSPNEFNLKSIDKTKEKLTLLSRRKEELETQLENFHQVGEM